MVFFVVLKQTLNGYNRVLCMLYAWFNLSTRITKMKIDKKHRFRILNAYYQQYLIFMMSKLENFLAYKYLKNIET